MNNWVILKSVFFLHAGYSLRALNNKFKMLVLVAKNWSELKLFCGRMSNALGKSGVEKLGGDCVGVVHWPYISRNWSPKNKLSVFGLALRSGYQKLSAAIAVGAK